MDEYDQITMVQAPSLCVRLIVISVGSSLLKCVLRERICLYGQPQLVNDMYITLNELCISLVIFPQRKTPAASEVDHSAFLMRIFTFFIAERAYQTEFVVVGFVEFF